MSTSRRDILAASFSLTSLLLGCGGGGDSSAPAPAPPAPVTPPPPPSATPLPGSLALENMESLRFLDTRVGIARANDDMLVMTTDAGAHWRRIGLPLFAPHPLFRDETNGFAFDVATFARGETLLITGMAPDSPASRSVLSTDGGKNWRTADMMPTGMASSGLLYIDRDTLLLSSDFGATAPSARRRRC